jgi:thiol-disulfide isomerase/thioredoxin
MRSRLLLTVALAALLPGWGRALEVGDPAPPLAGGEWLQGGPLTSLTTGKVYVVDFWASWCGPCVASIPALDALHRRHGGQGLVVIGQNVWEKDRDAPLRTLKRLAARMTFPVAMDDFSRHEDGRMATTWLEAAGQDGIPTTFVIDRQGRVAWIGHPLRGLDEVVASVLAGTFQAAQAAALEKRFREDEERQNAAAEKVSEAMQEGRWNDALAALEDWSQGASTDEERLGLLALRVQILAGAGKEQEIHRFVRESADRHPDNVEVLNDLAWSLVATPGIQKPDLDLAEKLATRSNTLAKEKEPHVLDTLARILFLQGQRRAIALQEKAVELAGEHEREMLEETLDSYRGGYLPSAEELHGTEGPEHDPEGLFELEPEMQDVRAPPARRPAA